MSEAKKRSNLKAQLELKEKIEIFKELKNLKENLKITINKMEEILENSNQKDIDSVILGSYSKVSEISQIRRVKSEIREMSNISLGTENLLKCEICGKISKKSLYEINEEIICYTCMEEKYRT